MQQISGPVGSVTCKLWQRDGLGAQSRGREGSGVSVRMRQLLLLLPRASGWELACAMLPLPRPSGRLTALAPRSSIWKGMLGICMARAGGGN